MKDLTKRQKEFMEHHNSGMMKSNIARIMRITPQAVDEYMYSIALKGHIKLDKPLTKRESKFHSLRENGNSIRQAADKMGMAHSSAYRMNRIVKAKKNN